MRDTRLVVVLLTVLALGAGSSIELRSAAPVARPGVQAPAAGPSGVREAAWAPDGRHIAVSWFDVLFTMTPEGRDAKRTVSRPGTWTSERDPAWSADGRTIAFSASTDGEFDLWIVPSGGGAATRLTTMPGDERWPSCTPDGRIVYSHREPRGRWQLFVTRADGSGTPSKLTPDNVSEWQARVSPDGKSIAFISDRDPSGSDDADVWVRALPAVGTATAAPTRVTDGGGVESHPAWAPDNTRIAYFAMRSGVGASVWVSAVPEASTGAPGAGRGRGGAGRGNPGRGGRGGQGGNAAEAATTVLASRHGGVPAWSPDSESLIISTFPTATGGYNGNPNRNDDDPPIALGAADDYEFWKIEAPRAVDAGAAAVDLPSPPDARWTTAFDQVWQTLRSLYYRTGPSASEWTALREKYQADASRARTAEAFEDVIDRMIAEQPLIKPALESTGGVVASAHPLASAAGARVLAQGGNVVDAGIAVSFALGVVEPDASSIGGDGQAILFLKGMSEPVVIEYKDMTPSHATADNRRLFNETGGRTATDGPTVANIPGVVAGLDLLYQKYGSKKVAWADLVAPAITLADEGFILDEALPTSIAQGRASFEKYPEAAKIFLPGGRVPKPGDRFVNKDYAETLRILAKDGGQSFYRGTIAERIAADMAANGGVITAEDLAQYRAMERKPIAGRYRDHLVYSVPPPVSTGLQVVETLQILDHYQARPGARYTSDADYLHYVIDAWRVRDGGARIADPERWPVDLGNHLEPGHALERFKLIDPKKAYAGGGGRGGGAPVPTGYQSEDETGRVQTGTTAFVVADAEGNMIAFTQTLSTWGGNYYVSKGLGFIYNDHFRGGGGRGGFGSMLPLMRSSSTSVPTLVFAPERVDPGAYGIPGFVPRLAVGCAGNAWIPASVYEVILNVVDGGMTAQQAIEAPRMLIGGGPTGSRVQIEDRFPRTLLAELESRGHTFEKVGRKGEVKYGYAAVAVVNAAKGTAEAGADPRRSHGTSTGTAGTPGTAGTAGAAGTAGTTGTTGTAHGIRR